MADFVKFEIIISIGFGATVFVYEYVTFHKFENVDKCEVKHEVIFMFKVGDKYEFVIKFQIDDESEAKEGEDKC